MHLLESILNIFTISAYAADDTAAETTTETVSTIVEAVTESAQSEAINNITSIAELINKYGSTVVVLALFLIVFLAIVLYILRANKKMNEQMLKAQQDANVASQQVTKELVTAFLNLSTGGAYQLHSDDAEDGEKIVEGRKKKTIVSSYIDSSLAFKDASRIAMSTTKCDRVAIYLFHNGNHSPYGYPFAKMSCVHEWTMRGSNTIRGSNHVNIPLYAFSNMIESLVSEGEYVISNIYEHGVLTPDDQIFQFISGATVSGLFALAIKDHTGELAAFTITEFKDPQDFSLAENYDKVKDALTVMNDNILSIVINEGFRDNYEEESSK